MAFWYTRWGILLTNVAIPFLINVVPTSHPLDAFKQE